jgi:hypothetical protein
MSKIILRNGFETITERWNSNSNAEKADNSKVKYSLFRFSENRFLRKLLYEMQANGEHLISYMKYINMAAVRTCQEK